MEGARKLVISMKRYLMTVITRRRAITRRRTIGARPPEEGDRSRREVESRRKRGEVTSEEVKKPWHVTPETGRVNSLK